MLINTISDFTKLIPTSEGTDYSAIEPFLLQAESQIKLWLTGPDLYDAIVALQLTDAAKQQLRILVANTAYHLAIPFADLIQTPNGFAVVSNSNHAPASKERVERLINRIEQVIDFSTDSLIFLVYNTPSLLAQWKKSDRFKQIVNCFFVTGTEYALYTQINGNKHAALNTDKGKLIAFQENILAPVISKVYLDQLIEEIRNNDFSDGFGNVMNYCRMILARLIEGNREETEKLLNSLSNLLDANLSVYTTYAGSDEYKLKSGKKYQNTADAPGYFFGM